MITFINTNIGKVNLTTVRKISGPDRRLLELTDGTYAEALCDPDAVVVKMLPAGGEFEVVVDSSTADNPTDFWVEPVIAWGVCLNGTVVPITPAEPAGLWSKSPLVRRKGETAVFHPSGGYECIEDYFVEQNTMPAIRTAD